MSSSADGGHEPSWTHGASVPQGPADQKKQARMMDKYVTRHTDRKFANKEITE